MEKLRLYNESNAQKKEQIVFFRWNVFFLHNLNSPFKNMTQNPGDAIARLKCDGTDRNLKWKGSYANGRGSDASYPTKPSQLDFFVKNL